MEHIGNLPKPLKTPSSSTSFLELSAVCEEVANEIEDNRASGNRIMEQFCPVRLANDIRRDGHSIRIVS
jgi:hypothetical protein